MVFIDAITGKTIPLGQQGEVNAITIRFPIYDWYEEYGEGGTFTLSNKRSCDPDGYECEVTTDDNYVYWLVKGEDASCKGKGRCELVYKKDGLIAKSEMYYTWVDPALNADPSVPPAWEGWVQRLEDRIDSVEEEMLIYHPEIIYSEDNVKRYVHDLQVDADNMREDIDAIEETLPSLDDLFIAEYGVTIAEDIQSAIDANKTVVLKIADNNSTSVRFASFSMFSETENETHNYYFTITLPKTVDGITMFSETVFALENGTWGNFETVTYTKEVLDTAVERIAECEDDINTINGTDLPMIRNYITLTPETYTITSWVEDDNILPFSYSAVVEADYTIGEDTQVELINNSAQMFALYGFSIGEVSGQQVKILAMDKPLSPVSLRIEYRW